MSFDIDKWAEGFGRLAESSATELALSAKNEDVAVGELFLIPSTRGGRKRFFLFRAMDCINILRRIRELSKVADTLVVEGDAYLASAEKEKLLYLTGKLLGYAEADGEGSHSWDFKMPRRLPEHFAIVYRPIPNKSDMHIEEILSSQLKGEIFVGSLLAGEEVLDVKVNVPLEHIPTHIGIFGTTGAGKSNFLLVFLKSVVDFNFKSWLNGDSNRASMLAIDPHDEFALGIRKYGIQSIVDSMPDEAKRELFKDFYYLTPHRETAAEAVRRLSLDVRIAYQEILPLDITSIMEVSDQMVSYMNALYARFHENWITQIGEDFGGRYPDVTINAVERRLEFVRRSAIFVDNPEQSTLIKIIEALEQGRILLFNTSLLSDLEQFLSTTVIARTIFELRKAVKSSTNWSEFKAQILKRRIPRTFREYFVGNREQSIAKKHYSKDEQEMKRIDELPPILITIEEAPSVLTPRIMRFENIYKDIARQGRKFRLGLAVISQQVTALDNIILSCINIQFNMSLTSADEIRAAISNASKDITGFENEFKVLGKGEIILTASYRDTPLVIYTPLFDSLYEKTRTLYQAKAGTPIRSKTVL